MASASAIVAGSRAVPSRSAASQAPSTSEAMAPLVARNEEVLLAEVVSLVEHVPAFAGRDPGALAMALWSTVHGMAQLVMLGHLPFEAVEPALSALVA